MSSSARRKPSEIDLQINARAGAVYRPFLARNLKASAPLIRTALRRVSVALVGDSVMADLHVQFLGIAGPTDVLTFELEQDHRGRATEGEIVICVPEARRRAREHGTRVEHELLLYAIHGLLHLSGYDDLTEAGFKAIHREEDRILTALGIGPVFVPQRTSRNAPRPEVKTRRADGRKKDGRSR